MDGITAVKLYSIQPDPSKFVPGKSELTGSEIGWPDFLSMQRSSDIHLFTSTRSVTTELLIWLMTASVSVALVALIVGAPLAQAEGHSQLASAIYKAFSFVCHQIPERSFHLAGHKFAVCSRCSGLYAGFAVTVLVYPLARSLERTDTPSIVWLILATLPLGIDFALGY